MTKTTSAYENNYAYDSSFYQIIPKIFKNPCLSFVKWILLNYIFKNKITFHEIIIINPFEYFLKKFYDAVYLFIKQITLKVHKQIFNFVD